MKSELIFKIIQIYICFCGGVGGDEFFFVFYNFVIVYLGLFLKVFVKRKLFD